MILNKMFICTIKNDSLITRKQPPRYLKQTISNCTEYKIQLLKQPVQESEPTSFPIIYNNDTKES